MINVIALLIGAILIGIGSNVWVGLGVASIGIGFHLQFKFWMEHMYLSLYQNLKILYKKVS